MQLLKYKWLTIILITILLCKTCSSLPLWNRSLDSERKVSRKEYQPQKPQSRHFSKYLSVLVSPSIAIFLFDKVCNIYEKYGPVILTRLQSKINDLAWRRDGNGLISFSGAREDPFVMKIANEVVRITNARLREKAVISRLQMDDDQYSFTEYQPKAETRAMAMKVMSHVLKDGSGKFLDSVQQQRVRTLIVSSAYEQ